MGKKLIGCSTMSKRALILVEGQTEERFIKDTLAPAFYSFDFYIQPTILVTKRVKNGPNFKGGITNFSKFEGDVRRLIQGAGDALVTTFIDYYGLPNDFPGMSTRPLHSTNEKCVLHVESSLHQHFGGSRNFLPFIVLHEFEALLFSDTNVLPRVMTETDKLGEFSSIRSAFATPEEINNHPETAPSKRILNLFPRYRKTLHGPSVASRIGLEAMAQECPHFSMWLNVLRNYAVS